MSNSKQFKAYFVKIYKPKSKTYSTCKSFEIINFYYESIGVQSEFFAKKGFECFDKATNTKEICQILAVAGK